MHITYCISHIAYFILHIAYYILHIAYYILHIKYSILIIAYYIWHYCILHFEYYILHFPYCILLYIAYCIMFWTFAKLSPSPSSNLAGWLRLALFPLDPAKSQLCENTLANQCHQQSLSGYSWLTSPSFNWAWHSSASAC